MPTQTQRPLTLVCEWKGNTEAPTSGENCPTFCDSAAILMQVILTLQEKESDETAQVLLPVCGGEQSLPAHSMMPMAPCTSLKLNSSQNS